jgi:deoxyribonuclease V
MDFEQTIYHQKELAKKVISKDILPTEIKAICGVDVSYKGNKAYCSAVILDSQTLEILESKGSTSVISSPYIPGFFMLREAKPILITLKKLTKNFDILLVDGHGRLHPRKCGLACYVGLNLDKPVIGVAKKILCGKIRPDSKIELDGKVLGYRIKNNKDIYVSTGHNELQQKS